MSAKLSVAEVLANLEARADFHRNRETFHAQQEIQHREQRAEHAAELEKVLQSLETFREVATTALSLAQQPLANQPSAVQIEIPASGRLMGSRLVRTVVELWASAEPFGAAAVAREVNRQFRDRLRKSVDERAASDVLRRMKQEGLIHLVRKGKAFHEALYGKGPRPAQPSGA
jgi:hypothetical protein